MAKSKPKRTSAQPPEKHTGLKLGTVAETAGGVTAVAVATKHIMREMGTLRGFTLLSKVNQHSGFDCPGCAWPDPDKQRSAIAEYCENGAKAVAEEATLKRVDPDFFAANTVKELAELSDYEIGKMGRLTHPMILKEGASNYRPLSWKEAFSEIAGELNKLDSPDRAIFYTSGRTSNEAAFLYQLFVRMYGTNNLPDCSNMCHESSGHALSQTVGIGKGSVTLEDLHQAEVIMVVGQNPGTNHPRMLSALQKCKENGGKIITVNPLPETGLMGFKHPQHLSDYVTGGTSLTDVFLQVRINSDVPLAKALLVLLLEAEDAKPGTVFDKEFIQEYCEGFDELISDLRKQDLNSLLEQSGIAESDARDAAQLLVEKDKIIICWAMGLTQHKNAVDNIKELVNILLLRGAIGREGAGTCPVRGHSNVQGDRTMGIWEAPKEAFLKRLSEEFHFEAPRKHGHSVVPAIEAMHRGEANVFFALGGNFLSATPDTEYTAEALRRCDLTVQVSTKLNRSHLIHGKRAIILPCLGRTERDVQEDGEQFVTVENSMGVVHRSRGNLEPASEHLLSEPALVAGLALATLGENSTVDWQWHVDDYDRIRDAIEACIPGFEDYNLRVRKDGGFYLPNGARERKFNTPDGKAHFSINPLPELSVGPGQYLMMTIRSHDQFNTTIYGLDDRYRGIYNERRVVLMNPEDIATGGFTQGEAVNIYSHYNGDIREARSFLIVSFNIPSRCIATYFPEANVLVPIDNFADGSKTPASKSIVCTIEKAG